MRMKNRQEMINDLIEYDIEINLVSISYIRKLMSEGHKGYNNMTDEEITKLWKEIQV